MNNEENKDSNDFLIKFFDAKFDKVDEKFNDQNEKFDRIDEEFKELRSDIKENHIAHIYDKFDEQNKMFNDKIKEKNKFIHKLEGSFDVVKSLLVVIDGGVIVSVIKYLFFS